MYQNTQTFGQPGMQQPGMQQPGMQQPGMMQPGMQQPMMQGAGMMQQGVAPQMQMGMQPQGQMMPQQGMMPQGQMMQQQPMGMQQQQMPQQGMPMQNFGYQGNAAANGNAPTMTYDAAGRPTAQMYQGQMMTQNAQGQTVAIKGQRDFPGDAQALYKAIKGAGTDDQKLIEIITTYSQDELSQLCSAFKSKYGEDLYKWVRDDTGGSYGKCASSLCIPRVQYVAKVLLEAIKGLGTDELTVAYSLLTLNNEELKSLDAYLRQEHNKSLEKYLRNDFGGKLKRLYTIVSCASRMPETFAFTAQDVDNTCDEFYKAAKGFGTDETVFMDLMCNKSRRMLAEVQARYRTKYNKDFVSMLKSEFGGDMEDAMVILARSCLPNGQRGAAWAAGVKRATSGVGTNESLLNMVTVLGRAETRSACDAWTGVLGYKKTLASYIKGDTSGKHEKILLKAWGLQ